MSFENHKTGLTFIWTIENFSYPWESAKFSIRSPSFTACSVCKSSNTEWYLNLYPRSDHNAKYLAYYLNNEKCDSNGTEVSAEYNISILSANGKALVFDAGNRTFKCDEGWGFTEAASLEDVFDKRREEFLPSDNLTVSCRILKIYGKPVEFGTCFARTHIGVRKTSFIWSIGNFSKLQPEQKTSILIEALSMKMELYFTGDDILQIEISQLDIQRKTRCNFQFSLLGDDGETVECIKDEHYFIGNLTKIWKFPSFITKSKLLKQKNVCLPNDVLNLRCNCVVSLGIVANQIENYGHFFKTVKTTESNVFSSNDESSCPFALKDDLQKLYKNRVYSDVSLRAGDKEFPAHKSILSARSPVFSTMFKKEDMLENKTGIVDITDLEAGTVDKLLIFFYTDTLKDLEWEDAVKLYIASDKYDVPHLKRECSSFLKLGLNQSNVVEILILSDNHCDDSLKACAHEIILGNEEEIFKSDEWFALMGNNPRFATETMRTIFQNK